MLPQELVEEISSESLCLKYFIKIPLVFMTLSCGLIVSTNATLAKCAGEVIIAGEYDKAPTLVKVCIFFAGLGAISFQIFVSFAMRYYDNISVIPI